MRSYYEVTCTAWKVSKYGVWSIFSCIRTRKISVFGQFSRSADSIMLIFKSFILPAIAVVCRNFQNSSLWKIQTLSSDHSGSIQKVGLVRSSDHYLEFSLLPQMQLLGLDTRFWSVKLFIEFHIVGDLFTW